MGASRDFYPQGEDSFEFSNGELGGRAAKRRSLQDFFFSFPFCGRVRFEGLKLVKVMSFVCL